MYVRKYCLPNVLASNLENVRRSWHFTLYQCLPYVPSLWPPWFIFSQKTQSFKALTVSISPRPPVDLATVCFSTPMDRSQHSLIFYPCGKVSRPVSLTVRVWILSVYHPSLTPPIRGRHIRTNWLVSSGHARPLWNWPGDNLQKCGKFGHLDWKHIWHHGHWWERKSICKVSSHQADSSSSLSCSE